jgi:hypothetical protein
MCRSVIARPPSPRGLRESAAELPVARSRITAEFNWQPTSEVIEDLYLEDIHEHLAWLRPLTKVLQRRTNMGKDKTQRHRALYEEEWDWGPELEW